MESIVRIKRLLLYHEWLKPFLEACAQLEAKIAVSWVSSAHKRLRNVQWQIPPTPEHFDHHIDLFFQWLDSRNCMWLERGVFSRLALRGGRVLELACGDGFNARNFYSGLSKEVIACDFDEKAIRVAKRKNHAENIKFVMSDIRENMPEGQFQNVIWDAAIEHFTRDEIDLIIGNLKKRLEATGILSGYTIIEREDKRKSLSHHEYEFKSKEDLYDLLRQYFKKVKVFSTCSPDRNNLYFWASDEGILPFDSESDCAIQSSVKMP